jgi:hypothetical protein
VMACQAASATASLREVLKAGSLCQQRILDPKKISAMALNSTRPEHETSLILYWGAMVSSGAPAKLKAYRRGSEIQLRRTPPRQHLGTTSHVRYRLGEVGLHQSYLPYRGPLVVALPLANPEQLGSQEPLALSRRVPPLELPLVVCWARILEAVVRSEVPVDRQVDGRCSCVWCGGYEPSNI